MEPFRGNDNAADGCFGLGGLNERYTDEFTIVCSDRSAIVFGVLDFRESAFLRGHRGETNVRPSWALTNVVSVTGRRRWTTHGGEFFERFESKFCWEGLKCLKTVLCAIESDLCSAILVVWYARVDFVHSI